MKTTGERMDPELAEALAAIPMGPNGIFDLNDIEGTRAAVREMAAAMSVGPEDTTVSIETVEVGRSEGPDVPIRLFRPAMRPGLLPALLWFHGGGQVLGDAAQEDQSLKRMSVQVGCVIAAVDYRLAPETRSPGAAEDCYLAYQ